MTDSDWGSGKGLSGLSKKKQKEYLLAGVLAVIIIGALALALWELVGGSSAPTVDAKNLEFHYKCEKCGKEFVKRPGDAKRPYDHMLLMEQPVVDCPLCGCKQCAYQMIRCPHCKKYYDSPSMHPRSKYKPGERPKDVCPHCKTDRIKWYRDHYKKRKK